tara:strand:- start:4324 stop:5505 length:1182 start_codon:yes stop_codon:yes gene_type:complete
MSVFAVFFISCGDSLEPVMSINIKEPTKKFIYGYDKDSIDIIEGKIKQNQSLSDLLYTYHVSYQKINEIANTAKTVYDVRKLAAGRQYEIICTKDSTNKAKCFIYHPNAIDYVVYKFEDSVIVTMDKFKVSKVEKIATGIINSSLYKALVDSGNSPKLAMELSDVYAWQIDFFGIQRGDNFKIIFDNLYVNGEFIGVGDIKAASFYHIDTTFNAFRFEQDSIVEFFDEQGKSLRKAFLKAPLSYRRISSKFNPNRLHPILKRRMPHLGVDYAAPKGTPVYSIGDGEILKANYAGAAGNYVKIKHNSVYTTGYLHLLKYGKGIKPGVRVKQGQLIGYVGSTGRSTGPHLDFRIWKNGEAIDPLKLKAPSAKPINSKHKSLYFKKIEMYKKEMSI